MIDGLQSPQARPTCLFLLCMKASHVNLELKLKLKLPLKLYPRKDR